MSELAQAAADRLVNIARRVDWTHVWNGLDCRHDELVQYHQHGRLLAHKDTVEAMADFFAVLREFGIEMRPEDDR